LARRIEAFLSGRSIVVVAAEHRGGRPARAMSRPDMAIAGGAPSADDLAPSDHDVVALLPSIGVCRTTVIRTLTNR
jgi:hypothetical protein